MVGRLAVSEVMNNNVISIKGFLFAGALILGGAVALFAAFPKGCSSCRKKFTEAHTDFSPKEYDRLSAVVHGTAPAAIRALEALPVAKNHRVEMLLSYCDGCKNVGEIRVREERFNGQFDEGVRGTKYAPISSDMVSAAADPIANRATAGA